MSRENAVNRLIADAVGSFFEADRPNWDGYGVFAVTWGTLKRLVEFIRSVPDDSPLPTDTGVEPDGYMTVEWYRSRGHELSVSVPEAGPLAYAGKWNEQPAVCGNVDFDGTWPSLFTDMVRGVMTEEVK